LGSTIGKGRSYPFQLRNDTFKRCQESNPEGYCLMHDDPAFCKTIGNICDEDGFVKPEYPYCTS